MQCSSEVVRRDGNAPHRPDRRAAPALILHSCASCASRICNKSIDLFIDTRNSNLELKLPFGEYNSNEIVNCIDQPSSKTKDIIYSTIIFIR